MNADTVTITSDMIPALKDAAEKLRRDDASTQGAVALPMHSNGPTEYCKAPEVQQIAEKLIEEHHPHLNDPDVTIYYIFRSDLPKQRGKVVAGEARKITNLAAYFASASEESESPDPFFAMIISRPAWQDLCHNQRVALVDHKLCHMGVRYSRTGEQKLVIVEHDLSEFKAVVERHGLWDECLQEMAETMRPHIKQLKLEME